MGSGSVDNYENWKRLRVLKGHSLDVVGLAWSPNDMFLVSCSLDSEAPICVWKPNVIVNPQQQQQDDYSRGNNNYNNNYTSRNNSVVPTVIRPFKVIGQKEHTSTVKGITFDPAGKYLCSSGDDPAICIWNIQEDWVLEERIGSECGIFRSSKRRRFGNGGSNSGGGSNNNNGSGGGSGGKNSGLPSR